MKNLIFYLLTISFLCRFEPIQAQGSDPGLQGRQYLSAAATAMGLLSADLDELIISDQYKSEHNGITHIYYQQCYKGIPIHNAVTSVHIARDGRVFDSPARFVSDIRSKANTTQARINPIQAMEKMILHYGVKNALLPSASYRTDGNSRVYTKTNFTHSDIPVKLVYTLNKEGMLRLSWDISMDLADRTDYWSTRIDALTGEVIDEHNYTVYCKFEHKHSDHCQSGHGVSAVQPNDQTIQPAAAPATTGASVYNVLPVPVESPIHGTRRLVTDPEYKNASPYGWHDTNGQPGAEFTITRGNNVNAYLDRNADNQPDPERADGGASLVFDFPFDEKANPASYTKAAMTNLFYMNNMMHDVLYQFGFNEAAGNFQQNNYGKGGTGGDFVLAEAQDGSGINNANFATPSDGSSGRMQMYLWSGAAGDVAAVEPSSIAGPLPMSPGSDWGGRGTETPLIGEVVWSDDGTPGKARLGCRDSQNKAKVAGKIVVIDRGECEFGAKALYAQKAGAIAVIICGFDEQNVSMAGGVFGTQVTIPAYFARKSICDKIIAYIENGLVIKIQKPTGTGAGPDSLDGDFDNGIIAHEYGHGVSNRLTGGPALSNCLGNAEQMGEGWSDFMSLIMTQKAGDNRNLVKGIGNYATNSPSDGNGIRRRPYATNMAVNEFTYKNINTSVHDLGEVWAVMLWDLYWALSDKYGYDPTFTSKTAGNNIAIQLVMDGMKLQPCRPGFVDGRNAILKADSINNAAANSCLIWEVFARRGLGYNASQGSSDFVGDETEDFEAFPTCINKTVVTKSAPYVIKAGEEFTVTIRVRNLRNGPVSNVVLEEAIPDGCTFVQGSASLAPVSADGTKIEWAISSMNSLEARTITYKLRSATNRFSNTLFYDDFEHPDTELNYEWIGTPGTEGNGAFLWAGGLGVNQSTAWWWETSASEARKNYLFNLNPISVPDVESAVFFYHKINTQQGIDGGFIDISTDGQIWERVDSKDFFINGYPGALDYSTFPIPFLKGFSGYVKDFTPVVLDISKYRGKDIQIRFNAGNDAELESNQSGEKGWIIDNLEVIKPYFYNSDLCMTTGLGERECVTLGVRGVLVDSKKVISSSDDKSSESDIRIFPNPARDKAVLSIPETAGETLVQLRSLQGQLLHSAKYPSGNAQWIQMDLSAYPRGMVLVEVLQSGKVFTQKLMLK
jgi:uncharacterized repeat protein (TIGR01451 family)